MSRFRLIFQIAVVVALTGCPASDPAGPPSLGLSHAPVELTTLASEAIDRAPSWLRHDLAIAMQGLDPDLQNEYGALIVDLDDPYLTDEVAFSVARMSPEVLEDSSFYPQLLVDNAELIYARDPALDYVEIVDVGDPLSDPDYSTTATYRVGVVSDDGAEEVVERTLERDVYYWYLVHPRGEDERPYYIDPDSPCSGGQCPTGPDEGRYWRDYLWTAADAECPDGVGPCPVLRDELTGEDLLWKERAMTSEDNGAIGHIVQWVNDTMHFGALQERSVQPTRIYGLHHGNCGEHGDITNAAARTALIPGIVIEARGNDHCWGEFWDGGWNQWEPVNTYVEYYGYYADAEGNYHRTLNGRDDDCDGTADEGADEADADEDGVTITAGDCDDGDAAIYPGAPERHNSRDDDCDGMADEGLEAVGADADGDGYSPASGDCHDLDVAIHPGAVEEANGRDDDCDGQSDEGTEGEGAEDDADEDGFSIAQGDCDDGNASVHPDAVEVADGRDQNCDGLADEGTLPADTDRDGDGWTVAVGDCDDTRGGVHPDADDPSYSSNRLLGLTGGRGDAYVINRTEPYVKTFELVVRVSDENGLPVDGALVWILGWSTVYSDSTGWWPVTEMATDATGVASIRLGEANEYAIRVDGPIGSSPVAENSITTVTDGWTTWDEVVEVDVELPGVMPGGSLAEQNSEVVGEREMPYRITVNHAGVESRVSAQSRMLHDSFSMEGGAAALAQFVVDEANYERFANGQSSFGLGVVEESFGDEQSVELTSDRSWYLVLANSAHVATTVVGTARVQVDKVDGEPWEAPVVFEQPYRIGPGQHLAIRLDPPDELE